MSFTFIATGNAENVGGLITSAIGAGAAPFDFTVSPSDATRFNQITGGGPLLFTLALINETEFGANSQIEEIILQVLDTSTGSLRCTARAQNGTTAQAWAVGSKIQYRVTFRHIGELQSAINNLIPSAAGHTGQYLTNDGTNVGWAAFPVWPVTQGGTGLTTLAIGDLLASPLANTLQAVHGDTTDNRKFLRSQSIGNAPQLPVWDLLVTGDLPVSGVTPGEYENAVITVNAQGQVVAAASTSLGSGVTSRGKVQASTASTTTRISDPNVTLDCVIIVCIESADQYTGIINARNVVGGSIWFEYDLSAIPPDNTWLDYVIIRGSAIASGRQAVDTSTPQQIITLATLTESSVIVWSYEGSSQFTGKIENRFFMSNFMVTLSSAPADGFINWMVVQ